MAPSLRCVKIAYLLILAAIVALLLRPGAAPAQRMLISPLFMQSQSAMQPSMQMAQQMLLMANASSGGMGMGGMGMGGMMMGGMGGMGMMGMSGMGMMGMSGMMMGSMGMGMGMSGMMMGGMSGMGMGMGGMMMGGMSGMGMGGFAGKGMGRGFNGGKAL